mgnify:FL=1|tara:strand:+ start:1352 stop:1666 length:315 start_codon:yes stop_codon:yes gene_type:complete
MPFIKGKSGNPKGRPKDPIVTGIRESLKNSINYCKLEESLESLNTGNDYIRGLSKLLPFILPRLNTIQITTLEDIENHISTLSDGELGRLSKLLIEEYEKRPVS